MKISNFKSGALWAISNKYQLNIENWLLNIGYSIRNKGFTLLELLVVVGIITILVNMGLSSFSTAQKKGRDAKRKTDIRGIQGALEQYYSVCGFVYVTPGS